MKKISLTDPVILDWIVLSVLFEMLIWIAFFSAPPIFVTFALILMWIMIIGNIYVFLLYSFLNAFFSMTTQKILIEEDKDWDDKTIEVYEGVKMMALMPPSTVAIWIWIQRILAILITLLNIKSGFLFTGSIYAIFYIFSGFLNYWLTRRCKNLYFYFIFKKMVKELKKKDDDSSAKNG